MGGEELLDDVAVARVELHAVHPGLLTAHRRLDEVLDQVVDLPQGHGVHPGGPVLGQLHLGGGLDREADALGLHAQEQGRALEDLVHDAGEAVRHRDHQGQGVDGAGHTLPARVVQLDAKLGPVAVEPLGELMHGRDMVIVAHGQLGKGRGAAHVVDAADAGDDHPHAALGPLLVIVHQALGGLAVGLAQAELRGGHHGAVLHRHAADLHGGKQHLVHRIPSFRLFGAAVRSARYYSIVYYSPFPRQRQEFGHKNEKT